MALKIFVTTVTASRQIKSEQTELTRILDSCGYTYEVVDIAVDNSLRTEMREKCGNPSALPPQLFLDDKHIGGFREFMCVVEDGELEKFLGKK